MTKVQMKDFKVSEIVDAIAENGVDHLREEWLAVYDGKISGGCVLGQGAFNLGVLPYAGAVNDFAINAPDSSNPGLLDVLDQFGTPTKWVDPNYSVTRHCGNAITHWNDKYTYEYPDGMSEDQAYNLGLEDEGTIVWALPTYESVVEMVREVLAPYMDEVVSLPVVDYTTWEMPTQ